MKEIIIIIFTLTIFNNCITKGPVIIPEKKIPSGKKIVIVEKPEEKRIINAKNIYEFFKRSEQDIVRARDIVVKKDIVKMLYHFQKMDRGGKRFYLLERDNITRMMNSVTRGVYRDYVIIFKNGTVIYTRSNNRIFVKNVKTSLKNTALYYAYTNKNLPVYFRDVEINKLISEKPTLFVSTKVSGENSFPGILALQIDVDNIKKLINKKTVITNFEGRIVVSHNSADLLKIYPEFKKIDFDKSKITETVRTNDKRGNKILYKIFKFQNISWIIIEKI